MTFWILAPIMVLSALGILFVRKANPTAVAAAVAACIGAAYWFTSSTSFANPAVTIARSLSDTFAGIRLADVPMFIVAQIFGAALAGFAARLARV